MAVNGEPIGSDILDSGMVDATKQSSLSVQRDQTLEAEAVQGARENDTNTDSTPDFFATFRDLVCQGSLACKDLERATSLVAGQEHRHDLMREGLERNQKWLAKAREERNLTEPEHFLEVAEAEDSVKLYTKRVEQCVRLVAEAQKTCAEARERQSTLEEAFFQLADSLPEQSLASLKLPAAFFSALEHNVECRLRLKDTTSEHEKAKKEATAMKRVMKGLAANFGRMNDQVESVEAVAFYRQVGKLNHLQKVEKTLHERFMEDERNLVERHGKLCRRAIKALRLEAQDADNGPEEQQKPDESISQEQPRPERIARVRMSKEQVAEIHEKDQLRTKRWRAKLQLDAEERKLEQLDQSYDDNLRRFKALQEPSVTRSDFDRTCLKSKMQQLHKIRLAEEVCHAARTAARDIGVEPSVSEESIFGSIDDGYRLSEEAARTAFDRERVESWLEGVDQRSKGILPPVRPDDVELLGPADQDNLLELNDSVSVIAVQKRRVKIDSWQEQTGTSKERAEIESRHEQSVASKRRRLK